MADRLGAIRKLLTHERPDRRVAAATVLLELGADDDKTVGALAGALADEHPDVRRIAVEALGQLEAVEVVDRMAALLADPNAETRVAAEAAVLRLGDEAVPALSRLLDGPAPARRAGAGLLSRLQSTAGLGSLVESVDGSDGAVADRARKALHDRARGLPLTELRALRKRLEQRLGAARHDGEDGLAAALLPLLGEMPDATVVTRILAETGAEVPPAVRKAGLAAITAPLALSRGRRRDAAELLGNDAPMHKYAVQITGADERDGGLSGSTLKEANSWGKVDTGNEQMVFAEATIAMPLLVGYAWQLEAHKGRPERRLSDMLETPIK